MTRSQVAKRSEPIETHSEVLPEMRRFELENLREDLVAGRFGGLPVPDNAASVLVWLLEHLGWKVDVRALAGAMPHFSNDFRALQLRAILHRLGYESRSVSLRGKDLRRLPVASMIQMSDGQMAVRQKTNENGLMLADPATGENIAISSRRRYLCVLFGPEENTKATVVESWTSGVWRRFAPEIRTLLFLIFLSNIIVVLISLSVSAIFDAVLPARARDTLFAIAIGLGCLLALDLTLRRIRARLIGRISGRLEHILGTSLFSKLISLPLPMLTGSPISEQMNRLRQFETVRDFFNGPVVAVLLELPFVLILLAIISLISPKIGLLAVGLVAIYVVVGVVIFPRLSHAGSQLTRARAEHLRFLLETLSQRTQISRKGLGMIWRQRMMPRTYRMAAARSRYETLSRILGTLAATASPFSTAVIVLFGATEVIAGTLSGGQLIAITILSVRLLAPIQQGVVVGARLPELAGLGRQIDTMMRIDTQAPAKAGGAIGRLESRISLDAVSLRYPRAGSAALNAISLEIESGEMIAVTGPSGSGKTSLLRTIVGHFHPQMGSVRIGGTNIDQLPPALLSEYVGYVSETPLMFHGTIAQNLLLSAPDCRFFELEAIAEELGILEAINALPQGFETRLDHEGQALVTPGFRRSLSVARVLLRQTPILLLDEPLIGLTPALEKPLIRALEARVGRVTILMVSQRPKHLQLADRVLVLNSGRVQSIAPPKSQRDVN